MLNANIYEQDKFHSLFGAVFASKGYPFKNILIIQNIPELIVL